MKNARNCTLVSSDEEGRGAECGLLEIYRVVGRREIDLLKPSRGVEDRNEHRTFAAVAFLSFSLKKKKKKKKRSH